jgi:putative hydrolase of the HAD superfamily
LDRRLTDHDILVFDIGKVLLSFEPSELKTIFSLSDQLYSGVFESGLWPLHDTGLIAEPELARLMCRAAHDVSPSSFLQVCALLETFYMHLKPLEASRWLEPLSKMGKKLYYLTNYATPACEKTIEYFPFFRFFNGGVISAVEHMTKPMPCIFRLLCERYGFDPERALFIDDNEENIRTAKAIGFETWLYRQSN